MREFNDFEQKIIHRLIELYKKPRSLVTLANIIDSTILPEGTYIEIAGNNKLRIKILNFEKSGIDLGMIDKEISITLITTCLLFDFLQRNDLIALTGNLDINSFGMVVHDGEYESADLVDEDIQNRIASIARKRITPTESLVQLAQNNFKSEEKRQFETELANVRKQIEQTQEQIDISRRQIKWSVIAFAAFYL